MTDADIEQLQRFRQLPSRRAAAFDALVWPTVIVAIASYQFWMCWIVSENTGTSFGELIAHDTSGFPARSYDGGFVRMFDRFVTGFCLLIVGGFTLLMERSARKRQLQLNRFHQAFLDAGVLPEDPAETEHQKG